MVKPIKDTIIKLTNLKKVLSLFLKLKFLFKMKENNKPER